MKITVVQGHSQIDVPHNVMPIFAFFSFQNCGMNSICKITHYFVQLAMHM